MKSIKIAVFGINSVACEAAAQSVGTVVHRKHTFDNILAGHFVTVPRYDRRNGTAGRNTYFSLSFHGRPSFL